MEHTTKYIFVTGGPMSGIGKGIIASSVAMLLGWAKIPTTAIKIDGYLNYDADTMSPFEHGEAYVTADGGVTDLDLGNYERFVGLELGRDNSLSMGKIHAEVARKERAGLYNGKTVQIVPHITDEIKSWIRRVASTPVTINDTMMKPKVCVIEIGGTVGDMETMPVFHAIKQMQFEEGSKNFCFIHVTHLSYVGSSDGDREEKTKPTQHNVELLRSLGVSPDIMIVRCEKPLSKETRAKLAAQCMVHHIIDSYNVPNIHYVPQVLLEQHLLSKLNIIGDSHTNIDAPDDYKKLIEYFDKIEHPSLLPFIEGYSLTSVKIGIVGKYTGMNDTYLSLIRAIQHASFANNVNPKIKWIDAEELIFTSKNDVYSSEVLDNVNGIIIPGGFGSRGINGMFNAIRYARHRNIPCFGICLGMQLIVSEYFNKINTNEQFCYHSAEWCQCSKDHVIKVMDGRDGQKASGQTMRLGNYVCRLEKNTLAGKAYKKTEILERHRHRYEINNKAVGFIEDAGMIFSGICNIESVENILHEIVELPGRTFHLGCQFHPEFKSRHWNPHPLFNSFIIAAKNEV